MRTCIPGRSGRLLAEENTRTPVPLSQTIAGKSAADIAVRSGSEERERGRGEGVASVQRGKKAGREVATVQECSVIKFYIVQAVLDIKMIPIDFKNYGVSGEPKISEISPVESVECHILDEMQCTLKLNSILHSQTQEMQFLHTILYLYI